MRAVYSFVIALASTGLSAAQQAGNNTTLPIVDLGYELHQAIAYNNTGSYYNFSNIRYAAPPVGDLRFAAPQVPATNRTQVQTGAQGVICPQANPAWIIEAALFVGQYTSGTFNGTVPSVSNATALSYLQASSADGRTSEDCLFLDVIVPQEIFDQRDQGYGAPVLVWIYGGGYTAGSKGGSGNPAGLLQASGMNAQSGRVIYVAMNYRLGATGWLSGPTFQANGGAANAGLYDQRFALEWVQKYIHLFGGDKNRVTVFGESAGGGSIMHQITAYGGARGPVPFQQAVPQSPGFALVPSAYAEEQVYTRFLQLLNVSTLQEARQLPSSAIIQASFMQIALDSPYGTFTYGPTVDGNFVPALPGQLLARGQFDQSVRVMVGHNSDEGLLFTNPAVQNDTAYRQYVQTTLPNVPSAIVDYITNVLYPPVYDGTYPYRNALDRAILTASESVFTCNTVYLDYAYNNRTFSYLFSVPPGTHGEDIPYTYYNGPSSSVVNTTVALALQSFITEFAETGIPGSYGGLNFNMYGNMSTVVNLNVTGYGTTMDPAANNRCAWWQKGLFN